MPEQELNTIEIPDYDDVTLSHTLNQFFLASLLYLDDNNHARLEPTFSVGGNVFKCRFEILRVICLAPPPTEENKQ